MVSMKKLMLGTVVLAGALGLGATTAQAGVRIGVVVGAPVAYVPPCPGPGYVWVNGYYTNGIWIPGRWNFPGVRPVVRFDEHVRVIDRFHGYDPHFDRGHFRR
jgi:hypothetical protein